MSGPPRILRRMGEAWNRFFHTPGKPNVCGALRIYYAFLVLVMNLVLLPDLELFFGETGLMPIEVSRKIIDPDCWTIFQFLPHNSAVLWTCFVIFNLHVLLLMAGCFSRVQAACVFFWLVSFQHRNSILFDGEDTALRMFGFFLIFMPIGAAYSVDRLLALRQGRPDPAARHHPLWALRLMQLQVCLIYLSTAWEKLRGQAWRDGTALYYVSRLDDMWGRFPLPEALFQQLWLLQLMTWSVLAVEVLVPLAIWFKGLRRWALLLAILFHVGCDYAMNLFLFHWVMILGWMSFVQPEEWAELGAAWARLRRKRETA